ncbi:hypothetical protein HMPREF9946_02138 [Acetobacteraceae bacterium AT-5844]|nr:hypothetical protein HMPREF9946_02138 [Acetobacteraceae bacterium AT-5844]
MSATATKRRRTAKAFAAPSPVAVETAALQAVCDAHPDAHVIAACANWSATKAAYLASEEGNTREDGPLWQAFEAACAEVSDATPLTIDGMAAKARVALADATMPDGSFMPSGTIGTDWAWQLARDIIRLQGSLPAQGDAELLADHAAFDELERRSNQMHADIKDDDALLEALRRIDAEQKRLLNRMASRRATTLAGLAARARTFLLYMPDVIPGERGADPDEYVNRRLPDILLRDVCHLTGVVPDEVRRGLDAPQAAAGAPQERGGFLTHLMQEALAAAHLYDDAATKALTCEHHLLKSHLNRVRDTLVHREFDLLDAATALRATSPAEGVFCLINAARIIDYLDCEGLSNSDREKYCRMISMSLYSAVHALLPGNATPELIEFRDRFLPPELDPLETSTRHVEAVINEHEETA